MKFLATVTLYHLNRHVNGPLMNRYNMHRNIDVKKIAELVPVGVVLAVDEAGRFVVKNVLNAAGIDPDLRHVITPRVERIDRREVVVGVMGARRGMAEIAEHHPLRVVNFVCVIKC